MGDPSRNREEAWEPLDVASAVPLGSDIQFQSFLAPPLVPAKAGAYLDEALHTLLVILVDDALLADAPFLDWLVAAAADPGMIDGRHQFLAVAPGSETRERWTHARAQFGRFQALEFSSLGEEAERLEWLALRVLHDGLHLMAMGEGLAKGWKICLFVSHAKRDGLSLAKSLVNLLGAVPWLGSFYDARDLSSYRPWEVQLEDAVASSVLVSLRTDIYDHRPYCQKEIRWAEEYGAPMVLVDARGGLVHAASGLPFEGAPCIRIPDGNLMRILHVALRVAARARAFVRRLVQIQKLHQTKLPAASAIKVIPVAPGMSAIAAACESLAKVDKGPKLILYPGPKLAKGYLEAAVALAAGADATLTTLADLLLDLEGAP
ncbi:MAG: toll/interleukin-1 receptor domain-containing protein [Acidobacteriota bacterium]|nr:toll/interleukin-1 receptor domain-containing protein [Acidobacteriota bacterium]